MIEGSRFPSLRTDPRFPQVRRRDSKCLIRKRDSKCLIRRRDSLINARFYRRDSLIDPRFYRLLEELDGTDESIYEDYGLEIPEENITNKPQETHRLSIINMDWSRVSAKDLLLLLNSFLPINGRILSVAVYPSELRIQRIEKEQIHGPDQNTVDDDEGFLYQDYHAVAECDSSATADHLYKSCDGIEVEKSSSNKLGLRFIPDSTEFDHPPRDMANEVPPLEDLFTHLCSRTYTGPQ